MAHWFLPYCWVCSERFTSATPPGRAQEERHHVIPVAYGGVDGLQVSLCDQHHTKAHRIAERLPRKPFGEFLNGENPVTTKKLLWLATRIANARETYQADPNRHIMMAIMLKPEIRAMMDDLKGSLHVRSREAVIESCITMIHRNLHPRK